MPKGQTWKARKVVLTLFNLNGHPVDESTRLDWEVYKSQLRYLSYQIERCPESGRLHLQCYIETKEQTRKAGVQKLFNEKCWCEPSRAPDGADNYTHKEDSRVVGPFIHGKRYEKSERTDISRVSELVLSGHSAKQILEALPDEFMRMQKGIERAIELRKSFDNSPRKDKPKVIIITGPPGTGKTSFIINQYTSENVYDVQFVNGFFNGYLNQPVALFDDFDPQKFNYPFILKLLDRYPMTVNVKNRSDVQWNPQVIVITNNYSVDTWYTNVDRDALYRRLDAVLEIRNGQYIDVLKEYMASPPALVPISYALPSLIPQTSSVGLTSGSSEHSPSGSESLSQSGPPIVSD